MSFFNKLFGDGAGGGDASEPPSMPWDQHPSIYEHILSHTDPDQPGLLKGGETLPDEARVSDGSQIRWAAGAMDGVLSHHAGGGEYDELVHKAIDLILDYCESPTAATKAALYQHVIEENTLPLIDPIIQALVENDRINHERLYELAYSFVTEAPDREPVKFGVAILGLYRNPANEELFQTIGRHDEFTLYCAVALSNLSDDPDLSLWTLARNVDGWGRIHVVERLANTQNPAIKDWLLREGYRNSVLYEYLAYTCATAGELAEALDEEEVDRELLTSAGEILGALIAGGPAEGIDDYQDGATAVDRFLGHMEAAAETNADFVHVHTIKQFLDDEGADWDIRASQGWTEERRRELRAICDRILNRPEWSDRARGELVSDDDLTFHRANQVAETLGLETWDTHWRRLQAKPIDSGRWYHVMTRCEQDRIADVISFAERTIDLEKIAVGPGGEMGLGPGWEHHQCLDFILNQLCKFPGQGGRLVQAGLRSPVVRNRNMAVAALSAWGRDRWGDDLRGALEAAAKIEPEDDVRERMQKTLRGESLDDD